MDSESWVGTSTWIRTDALTTNSNPCNKLLISHYRRLLSTDSGLLRDQRLLQRVEVRHDVAREYQTDLLVINERRRAVLRLEECDENFGVADGERIEEAHRLVDLHVGERLGVAVEVRPLQNALHQHVALHLLRASARVLRRRDPEA